MPHLRLFGYPALIAPTGVVERFRTRKHLALLAYLALEARTRPAHRDHLIELLWPDAPPERGSHSLAQALSVLRQKLGRDAIGRGGPTVQLHSGLSTDLETLGSASGASEHLERPLAGFEHLAGTAFAHWLDAAREHLGQVRAGALHAELEAQRRAGDAPRVHEVASRLYVADPLSEAAVQALCEQYLNDGDVPGAAKLLRRHLKRVEQETGGPASAGLRRLLQQVETGHLATRRVDRSAPRASQHRRPEAFVGRAPDVSRLEALWSQVLSGQRRTCLVAGPAGIGKSSLLGRFATSVAARSAAVWEVSCQEIGRDIPFAAVSDIILALAQYPAAGGTDARWLSEASRVAPGLRDLYSGIPDPPQLSGESIRLRLAEAVVRIVEAVGEEGPMLLVLDDLMYLDPASRDILHLLLQRHEHSPLFVLASARTTDEQGLTRRMRDPDIGIAWDEVVSLGALTEAQVHLMMCRLLDETAAFPEGLVHAVTDLAEGNPYLVEMLLSDWRRQGKDSLVEAHLRKPDDPTAIPVPHTMHRAFERQYADLTPEAERMLSLLAVVGRRLSASEITQLLNYSSATTDTAALQLLDRGVLRIEAGGLGFKNQLHRSFVYRATTDGIRQFLHSKVAAHLESNDQDEFQDMFESAYHHLRAGNRNKSVDVLLVGAEVALDRGAPSEAAQALQQMIKEVPDHRFGQMKVLLADTQLAQGHHADAVSTLQPFATTHLEASVEARRRVIVAEAHHRGQLAPASKIIELARSALQKSESSGNQAALSRSLQLNAEAAHDTADSATIRRVLESAEHIVRTSNDPQVIATALVTTGYCMMVTGSHRDAATTFSRACSRLRTDRRENELRRALNGLGICLTNLGELTKAQEQFETALALANQAADPFSQSIIWDNLAVIHEDLGRLEQAVEARKKAFELARLSPTEKRRAELLTNAASLAITLESLGEAASYLDEALVLARKTAIPGLVITVLAARADLAVARREYADAWSWAEEAISVAERHQDDWRPMGDFRRVQLHFLWATRGYSAYAAERDTQRSVGLSFRLTQRLELSAFCDWVNQEEASKPQISEVPAEMFSRHLYGSIMRLAVLGVLPAWDPTGGRQQASTLSVKEAFPDGLNWRSWPVRVDAPQ